MVTFLTTFLRTREVSAADWRAAFQGTLLESKGSYNALDQEAFRLRDRVLRERLPAPPPPAPFAGSPEAQSVFKKLAKADMVEGDGVIRVTCEF